MNDDAQSAEPKPKQKRPWSKPRLHLIEMDFTKLGGASSEFADTEATALGEGGTITGTRYRMS